MSKLILQNRKYRNLLRTARLTKGAMIREIVAHTEGIVQAGPLKGYKLPNKTSWGNDAAAQIYGYYEQQLLPYLTEDPNRCFVDIGAADGYWAVGLVASGHCERAIAFESRGRGRRVIKENAEFNSVADKVQILGMATPEALENVVKNLPENQRIFVLIDIEGAEFDLLNSEILSVLRNSNIIVELHPWTSELKDPVAALIDRAKAHFDCELITDAKRDVTGLLDQVQMHDIIRYNLISEGRGFSQNWLILKPLR